MVLTNEPPAASCGASKYSENPKRSKLREYDPERFTPLSRRNLLWHSACGLIRGGGRLFSPHSPPAVTTIRHGARMNGSIDMNVKWIRGWLLLTLEMLVLLSAGTGIAGEANDQLKQSVDKVLAILNDPTLKGTGNSQERRQKIKEVIYARFDFNEMAKRSLGPQWQKRSPEEQKEFVQLFTSLLEYSYIENIESYNGEKIRFLNQRQDKDFAEVNTKLINNKGQEFSLDYRLKNENGDWKVIDVVIENISLVNNYRAQFNRLLAKSSFAELLDTMKQKKLSVPGAKS
jgi:phospholipid transport system substrate-binding protein